MSGGFASLIGPRTNTDQGDLQYQHPAQSIEQQGVGAGHFCAWLPVWVWMCRQCPQLSGFEYVYEPKNSKGEARSLLAYILCFNSIQLLNGLVFPLHISCCQAGQETEGGARYGKAPCAACGPADQCPRAQSGSSCRQCPL